MTHNQKAPTRINIKQALICILLQVALHPVQAAQGIEGKLDILTRESNLLQTFTLDNGLHVILKPDATAPVASVQFWVHSGSIHEEQFTGAGIAHAVEHMIFKGTPDLPTGELSRRIQEAGGRLNAYTTFDRTVYFADLPANQWKIAFDLYAEALFRADFAEAEWITERDVILREIAMGQDDPGRVLNRHLWQTAVRVAPYRHPVIGYTETFSALSREDLVTFHKRHYTPCNMVVVIVGDLEMTEVREHVTASLAPLPRPPRPPVMLPEEPRQATPRRARFTAPHQVARMAWMWQAPVFPHPDAAALQVLAHIAGSGRTARLHRSLVEDQGVFLGLGAWYFDRGFWGISGQLEPDQEQAAFEALEREVRALQNTAYDAADVEKAIISMVTGTLQGFTTMSGQAAHYGRAHQMTGNPAADRFLLEQIAAVTPEDVARVARTWLHPDRITQVVVSPKAETLAAVATSASGKPEVQRVVLPNGITVLLRPDSRLPFVYVAAALQGGLLAEPEGQAGVTTLMAELLTRGTRTRTRDAIAETVESRGASLSTFSGFNAFGVEAQGLTEDTDILLALTADILANPIFPQEEIERQRPRQLAAIRRNLEQPLSETIQEMRRMLFPGHPYQYIPDGTLETVAELSRNDLVAHHERLTTTGNLVLAIFGDIQPDTLLAQLAETFSTIPAGAAPKLPYARPQPLPSPQRQVQEADRQQAIVVAGFPALDIFDPQVAAVSILQTALSGMSSALFEEIREKRGLAYFTGATQQSGLHPGFFAIYAGTQPDATAEVEQLIQIEIDRIRESGLTPAEFDRARAQLLASHDMRLQNQMSIAVDAALHERYGLGVDHIFTLPERLLAVTPEHVQAVASRIFQPDQRATAILVPAGSQPEVASDAGTVGE